jgi:hypothetical protein
MEWLHSAALAAALAWASGIRLYAVLCLAGILAHTGYLALPPALAVLAHPAVIAASGVMAVGEFAADKVPAFDSVWDGIHTFIRIPAGAFLAAAALGDVDPVYVAVAAILGGVIASGAHLTKASGRALVNMSPEPFSNWAVSLGEDLLVPAGFVLAIVAPVAFLALLALFAVSVVWAAPRLARGARRVYARLRGAPEPTR